MHPLINNYWINFFLIFNFMYVRHDIFFRRNPSRFLFLFWLLLFNAKETLKRLGGSLPNTINQEEHLSDAWYTSNTFAFYSVTNSIPLLQELTAWPRREIFQACRSRASIIGHIKSLLHRYRQISKLRSEHLSHQCYFWPKYRNVNIEFVNIRLALFYL